MKISSKVASLKVRVEDAIAKNTVMMLREGDQTASITVGAPDAANETSLDALETMLSVQAGEKCCYLIFKSSEAVSEQTKKLLVAPLNFKRRQAIERSETLGRAGKGAA